MKHFCAFFCALLICAGCTSDADKAKWDDAWRDFRGDNMQMKNNFSGPNGTDDQIGQPKRGS